MKIKKKSQLTGILLSFFLGPFGLFYSMGWKALIVTIVWVFLAPVLSADEAQGLFVLIPISSIVISLLAVNIYNNRVESDVIEILNEQAKAEMKEGRKVEEARLRNEEVEKVKLNAEKTKLARERIGLDIERERLRSDESDSQKVHYASHCSACGAVTPREFREGTIQKAAVCDYCGSPLKLREQSNIPNSPGLGGTPVLDKSARFANDV